MVYERQIATAKRLIADKGQSVTWRTISDGAPPDPTKPWKPAAATNTDYPVKIVFFPDSKMNNEFLRALLGTEVPKGKIIGLMAAVTFEPQLKDSVIRGSETLGIESIDPLAPNGEIILYTIRFDR